MSGHHDKFGRLTQRRALQAASGALRRFRDDFTTSHKGEGWTPRSIIAEHRDALADAAAVLGPIIADRVRTEVQLDAAEKAEAAVAAKAERVSYSSAPGARIGEAPSLSTVDSDETLESFKAEVADVLASSPDSGTARRRVQALLAVEASRLALKGGSR